MVVPSWLTDGLLMPSPMCHRLQFSPHTSKWGHLKYLVTQMSIGYLCAVTCTQTLVAWQYCSDRTQDVSILSNLSVGSTIGLISVGHICNLGVCLGGTGPPTSTQKTSSLREGHQEACCYSITCSNTLHSLVLILLAEVMANQMHYSASVSTTSRPVWVGQALPHQLRDTIDLL